MLKYRRQKYESVFGNDELRLFLTNAAIIVAVVTVLACTSLFGMARKLSTSKTFSKGVRVNDIELYGMTYKEAIKSVKRSTDDYLSSINIKLTLGKNDYILNAAQFVFADVDSTVKEAYSIGKADSDSFFEDTKVKLYTTYSISMDSLKEMVGDIAEEVDTEPVEPYAVFDTETHTFNYIEGIDGIKIDVDDSIKKIAAGVSKKDFSTVELSYDVVAPSGTVDDVRQNTKLVSEYSSVTTNNYNRNRNIQLMCEYVSGQRIAPGDILSINELVGQRTEEKGFLAAPAIMDGKRTVDDIGGGICQLSGTLYNAALLANMRIAERLPHSWPSDYLPIGLDSTLDWNSQKDLKLENVTEHDMFIVAWLENSDLSSSNKLHVEIYGEPFVDGMSVKVRSEIVEVIEPESPRVTTTSKLSSGQSRIIIQERKGYRTRTWRDFYYKGVLIDTELVNSSYYAAIRGEIEVGKRIDDEPGETPTPTNPITDPTPTLPPALPPIVDE